MQAALIILLALVVVGTILYVYHRLTNKDESPMQPAEPSQHGEQCCGMHIACEKDSLLASVSNEIVYYDDEELDAYKGRQSAEYDEAEIEQFRDVLLTLLPTDIAGWGRSLQLRGIDMPDAVKEELLMIVAEERMRNA